MRTPGEATEGMEKIATHGSIQKSVMDAMGEEDRDGCLQPENDEHCW